MKKRILSMLLTVVMLASVACVAFAAGGVETPMVPIGSLGQKRSFATVRLTSNADSIVYIGDIVQFTTNITEIESEGLSSVNVVYTFSEGLSFNNDVKIIGAPEGWSATAPVVSNNVLSFTVSGATAVVNRTLDFTFSFTVVGRSGSELSVAMSDVELYNGNGNKETKFDKKVLNSTFSTEAAVPNMSNIGASLRINNTPALRLGMLVTKDSKFNKYFPSGEFIYSENADVKFGMVIIEESKLNGDLKVTTANATSKIFETAFSSNVNEVVFVHTINNVTDYDKSYVFRPFVMYREAGESEYTYSYGDVRTRSAKKVAELELVSEVSTKKIELLKKFTK